MDGIDAIKQVHEIGEMNVLLSLLYIAIIIIALYTIGKKAMEILGLETKASLYKKAQEQKILSLEKEVKHLSEEIENRENNLYRKQKGYHEQSIQIRDELKHNQEIMDSELKEIKNLIIDNNVEYMRYQILDFANAVMSGREYNKEQYDHILDTHKRYEKVLEENHMTNGQTTASMDFINKRYAKLMETGFRDMK